MSSKGSKDSENSPPDNISPDQAWFWSETWQRMEQEADKDIAAGRVKRFDSAKEFLNNLGK